MPAPTFDVFIDWGRDGTYGHASANVTTIVEAIQCSGGMTTYNQEMAQGASATFILRNDAGQWLMDNVGATFYSLLKRGLLVRWRMTYGGTTQQMWAGRIVALAVPSISQFAANKQVQLQAADWSEDFANATYTPKLSENVRVDTELETVFTSGVVPMPYPNSAWVVEYSQLETDTKLLDMSSYYSFDTAQQTLEYTGDESGTAVGVSAYGYIQDLVMAEMGGRWFYDPRSTKYMFHDRQHDLRTATATATLTPSLVHYQHDSGYQMPAIAWGDTMISSVAASYELRTVGAAGSVVWSAENLPRIVRAGKTVRFTARYRDPDSLLPCGAKSVIYPQRETDYTTNTASDGSGTDWLSYTRVLSEIDARGARLKITNNSGVDMYLLTCQLRGTPLVITDKRTVEKKDAARVGAHGLRHVPVDVPYADDATEIEAYAKIILAGGDPIARFPTATFDARAHDTLMVAARDIDIGERISLDLSTDSWTTHSRDYIVVGFSYVYQAATAALGVTWTLKPTSAAQGWILEDSERGVLESTTVLVF